MTRQILIFFLGALLQQHSWGASLPTGMNQAEVEKTVETIGAGGVTRLLRSAESYDFWPGIKMGFEAVLFGSQNLGTLGNQDNSMPSTLFVPRLYLAKGLIFNTEIIFSILPDGAINTISTYGVILKWNFLPERDNIPGSVAAYLGYTKLQGLGGYEGTDWEIGLVASRDLVRIKPFFGLGLLFASGTVSTASTSQESKISTLHLFAGLEWELPVNITAQVDLMNLDIMGSLLLGKRF